MTFRKLLRLTHKTKVLLIIRVNGKEDNILTWDDDEFETYYNYDVSEIKPYIKQNKYIGYDDEITIRVGLKVFIDIEEEY